MVGVSEVTVAPLAGPVTVGAPGGAETVATSIQFKFHPPLSITTRMTCCPALNVTFDTTFVVHVCHPPVFGILCAPVTFTPFISTWNVQPVLIEATRRRNSYVPAVTLTVYSTHSLESIKPTLNPPPVSVVPSISTSVERYAPPALQALRS